MPHLPWLSPLGLALILLPALACAPPPRPASASASASQSASAPASAPTPAPTPAPAPAPTPTPPSSRAEACLVWDRELSFARAVHEHDARAFAEHVLPGAVFVDGPDALLRGRAAIIAGWAGTVRGEGALLEWRPAVVEMVGARTALSRGPYWLEVTKPDARTRFLTGTFQTTWVKDADGAWRAGIDGAAGAPTPATEDEVRRLRQAGPQPCPR